MTSCIGFLISMFGTRMCGQTLLFIVIANGAIVSRCPKVLFRKIIRGPRVVVVVVVVVVVAAAAAVANYLVTNYTLLVYTVFVKSININIKLLLIHCVDTVGDRKVIYPVKYSFTSNHQIFFFGRDLGIRPNLENFSDYHGIPVYCKLILSSPRYSDLLSVSWPDVVKGNQTSLCLSCLLA